MEGRSEGTNNLLRHTLLEYIQKTALHGMRYLGERGRPWNERVWWVIATFTSLVTIVTLILQAWQQWDESPVLVSFADKPTALWEIPFPTVTVCPMNKYERHKFDADINWRSDQTSLTTELKKLSDDLRLVCRSLGEQRVNLTNYPLFSDQETLHNLVRLAPSMDDTIECSFTQDRSDCMWMMDTQVTREGLCFTYNALPGKGLFRQRTSTKKQVWSLESGYRDKAGLDELPKRASGVGFIRGVGILLKTNYADIDLRCRPFTGFKLALSSPADFPRIFERYHFLPPTGITHLAVTPYVTDTEEALRSYNPDKRHCYFPSERRLTFFSEYTQDNCDLECLTNFTLKLCNCVDFYMPRNSSTPVCGYGSADCMHHAESELYNEFMQDKIKYLKAENTCNCLPSCKSIEYSAEMSQGSIDADRTKDLYGEGLYTNITFNVVFIFFKNAQFIPVRRRQLHGIISFIANCGGLLGFCCGFSMLSLIELLYFLILRLWNNLDKKRQSESDQIITRVTVHPLRNKTLNKNTSQIEALSSPKSIFFGTMY